MIYIYIYNFMVFHPNPLPPIYWLAGPCKWYSVLYMVKISATRLSLLYRGLK